MLVPEPLPDRSQLTTVRRLSSSQDEERRKKLLNVLQLQDVPASDADQLRTFLTNNHDVFSLEEGERGETSVVKMEIDTGNEPPQKQPPRRMPVMVREEVGRQLRNMQRDGAVRNYPRPEKVQSVRRFLGMASYYRRLVPGFAKIAQPLHHLTAKEVPYQWSPDCETAFVTLKSKLVTPPVLAYPRFGEEFTLETDAG